MNTSIYDTIQNRYGHLTDEQRKTLEVEVQAWSQNYVAPMTRNGETVYLTVVIDMVARQSNYAPRTEATA